MSDYAVVLAARMGSSRLPGKALADYGAGPILRTVIDRWRMSDRNPTLIFTTTTEPADDPLAHLAHEQAVPVSRGDPSNVVAQMDAAITRHAPNARYVARALADNPLVDVGLADWRLDVLTETGADGIWYGGREAEITYAGTTDIWSRAAWDRIVADSSGSQLEHPGEAYWNHISRYNVVQLPMPRREYLASVRTELDTELDLQMLAALWRDWHAQLPMPTLWALKHLEHNPEIAAINGGVPVKTQSKALFPNHFKPRLCANCQRRVGSIVDGNLRTFCPGCGAPQTFYSNKPARR